MFATDFHFLHWFFSLVRECEKGQGGLTVPRFGTHHQDLSAG